MSNLCVTNDRLSLEQNMENTLPDLICKMKNRLTEEELQLIPSHPHDDEFLAMFIRGRKYDLDRGHQAIQKYISVLSKNTDIIAGLCPSKYVTHYECKNATVLKHRDAKGRHILLIRCRRWDSRKIGLLDALLSDYLMIDQMITSRETQRNGMSVIVDLKDLSLHQTGQMTPSVIKLCVDMIQGSLPVSFKEVHVINHPYIFNIVYSIGSTLLKEKMRKRVQFHRYNTASLHKFLSPDILPKSLGGKLSNEEAFDETILKDLLARDDYFKETSYKVHTLLSKLPLK